MHSLQPYDTRASKGFITTLALAFIPRDMYNVLDLQRRTPKSKFLDNPDPSVKAMINLLDPTIGLLASDEEASGDSNGQINNSDTKTKNGGTGSSGNGSVKNDPVMNPNSGGSGGTITTRGAAIGGGVVAGALAYGGAMFFIARRYRQKHRRHTRSSSLSPEVGGPLMTANPVAVGAMMHGARNTYTSGGHDNGNGRESAGASNAGRNISGPLTAANSLGWN